MPTVAATVTFHVCCTHTACKKASASPPHNVAPAARKAASLANVLSRTNAANLCVGTSDIDMPASARVAAFGNTSAARSETAVESHFFLFAVDFFGDERSSPSIELVNFPCAQASTFGP